MGLTSVFFLHQITDSYINTIGIERKLMIKEERRINQLKRKLAELGPMLPGSISKQWNVCGTPRCRCKDADKPLKHGPYYQLSFTVGGKSSTMFVKKEDLPEAQQRLKNYQQFKTLSTELVHACIAFTRKAGFKRRIS